MARDLDSKCKKCRRAGEKLFLKGDRCNSPKCAVIRRPHAPGQHGKNIARGLSEFGKQLAMKQRIKRMYGVLEKQFRRHFEEAKGKKGVTGDMLLARLELRLDNVVRKMGFASAPAQARQLVNHGHFTVNGKKVDIPSFEVKIGDVIGINETKKDGAFFASQLPVVKNKKDFPSWIQFDAAKYEGKVISLPVKEEIDVHVDPQMIVEYYSR